MGLGIPNQALRSYPRTDNLHVFLRRLRALLTHLDQTDLRIVRALLQGKNPFFMRPGARVPLRAVARDLRLPEATVRRRIQKLRSGGLLSRTRVYVNPSLLRLTGGNYSFNVAASMSKREALDRLRLVDGVIGVDSHHGRHGILAFLFEDEEDLRRKLALFRSIAHAEDDLFDEIPFPPCHVSLSRFEWKMVSRLVEEGLVSTAHLAAELGVSAHTVNRELLKLADANAIFAMPMLNGAGFRGGVAAVLSVSFSSPSARPQAETELLELVEDKLIQRFEMRATAMYAHFLPNTRTASELSERINQIEGVTIARIDFVDEHAPHPEIQARYVRRRVALMDQFPKADSQMRVRPRASRTASSTR